MSSNLNESVPPRNRKILRDNIEGIKNSQLLRLAHVAKVERLSGLSYEQLRVELRKFLEPHLHSLITLVRHANRKTVLSKDIIAALKDLPAVPRHVSHASTYQTIRAKRRAALEAEPSERHAHPGTRVAREIKFESKVGSPSTVYFPRVAFERLVREISQDHVTGMRFSANALAPLQILSEHHLIDILGKARGQAEHAGRRTVMPKDIQMVLNLQ
jgi:histone H3/H4